MLIQMSLLKQAWKLTAVTVCAVLLAACGIAAPAPTVTAVASFTPVTPSITPSPIPTTTPSPTNTFTATPEPVTPPGCMIVNEDGKLYVLSDDVFFAFGPASEEIDQALADNYPEWANYEQNVSWDTEPAKLGEIVREASFQEKFALNSEVTLVTLGESLHWQLPSDSDLFLQSLTIGERLVRLWDEYSHPDNESIRSSYPEVTNGATYALYAFFNYDKERLKAWCDAYHMLFETSR